jgi:DNA-binding Lrp family transcriptional regulator
MTECDLLDRAQAFLSSSVMRRFAAVLKHTRAGYRSNAMVCWRVEDDRIDEIGARFASHPAVSHCYRRPTSPDWPYPLYTMVHCRSAGELDRTIQELADLSGLHDYLVLRSLREYKKTRVRYFNRE